MVGPGAPAAAAALIDALTRPSGLQRCVVAAVRVGERRWNLQMSNGTDVMLPEGHEVAALDRLMQLQQDHALLDRPLAAIDMRLPDRLVLRPRPTHGGSRHDDMPQGSNAAHVSRGREKTHIGARTDDRHSTPRAAAADAGPRRQSRPRHHRAGPFGVLDIGTTKIACLIGRTESDGTLRVLGFGWQRGRGVRGGGIVDLEDAEKAIRACVGQAEDMADTRLRVGHRQPVLRPAGIAAVQCAMAGRTAARSTSTTSAAW